jgi:hypothetical protein
VCVGGAQCIARSNLDPHADDGHHIMLCVYIGASNPDEKEHFGGICLCFEGRSGSISYRGLRLSPLAVKEILLLVMISIGMLYCNDLYIDIEQ